jgi:hypothetical protein
MLVIKIDEAKTQELLDDVMTLVSKYNVVHFSWEADTKVTPAEVRSGATGKDLSAAVSAAVDKVQSAKQPS